MNHRPRVLPGAAVPAVHPHRTHRTPHKSNTLVIPPGQGDDFDSRGADCPFPFRHDDRFASDPCVLHDGRRWVMFYFGNCSDGHARESVAFPDDLLHWRKSGEILVDIGPAGHVDDRHAHKPGLISDGAGLHHFYCAVRDGPEGPVRGIARATG
ncbi:hypothetical protein ACIP4W_22850 [Streptomyces sp. NPDC088846]|uniref:hypothetical protein n=1 Tax=unclassified Streptomyces TaxID=2593676 RepID=UPI00382EB35C